MTAAVAVGVIDLYQQFISPYKGFRCAHRAVRGRCSCSQFAKRLVAKVGLLRFGPLLVGRLRRCGEVARALKAGLVRARQSRVKDSAVNRRDNRNRTPGDGCQPGSCDAPDVGGCDAPAGAEGCDCAAGGCDPTV